MARAKGHDPVRSFRAGDEYDEAKRIAGARGEQLGADVLRPALIAYVRKHGGDAPSS